MPADRVSLDREAAVRAVYDSPASWPSGSADDATVGEILDALMAAGWQLAPPGSVVVQLPQPHPVGYDSTRPAWEWPAGDGVEYVQVGGSCLVWDLDNWRGMTPAEARARAAALLAAAVWTESRETTPAPETGGPA